jgi:hypothetical protein
MSGMPLAQARLRGVSGRREGDGSTGLIRAPIL